MATNQIKTITVSEYGAEYLSQLKQQRWFREAEYVTQNISSTDLVTLIGGAAGHLGRAGKKRIKSLSEVGKLAVTFTRKSVGEGKAFINAAQSGHFRAHCEQRYSAVLAMTSEKWASGKRFVAHIKAAYERNPAETVVDLLCLSAGFYAGSGGLDGNGGVPDMDISMFGIGQHRSIVTHSIIAGMAVETLAMISIDVVSLIYQKLPENHDPFWDEIHNHQQRIFHALNRGVSLGISYHLAVDGLAQPAPYHDLPLSMPIEGHQTLLVANAVGEGLTLSHSGKTSDISLDGKSDFSGNWQYCHHCEGTGGGKSICTSCAGTGWQRSL